uniref:F-box domain-containing protein n=2 Tax=Brassica campestris TaxID=3711 RepID=M4D401_BRACM
MGSRVLPDWTELTPECLLDIFSRLSIGQLWNGPMLVCKTWTKLCHDPSLNITLDLEAEFLSSEDSNHWWSPEFEEKVDSTIRSVVDRSKGGLKEIRVRHCTDQSLSYVAERCPNLEVLGVTYSPKITVESMRKIASNCTKLIELDISCSYEISGYCIELVDQMGSRVHPDWTELPPECLLGIFSRLSMGQRRNGQMLVCKTWKNLCQDPSLNTILDLKAEFLSSADSIYWWSPESEEKVNSTIRSVVDQSEGGLKEIRVRHCTDQSLFFDNRPDG